MVRHGLFFLPLVTALHLTATTVSAQPRSGLYQIQAGQYSECCGIAGGFEYELPDARQAFIDLSIDRSRNSAHMRILQGDKQTVFRPGWSRSLPRFDFDNGMILPDRIEFESLLNPFPDEGTRYKYVLYYANDTLSLNGDLHHPICCDIPMDYNHTNVAAIFLHAATLSIRVLEYPWTFEGSSPREIEVCWDTMTNRNYQLQFLSPTNTWINFGAPLAGTGARRCIKHDVLLAPGRIYRVFTMQ
jgi:hypothetical protein